MKKNILNRNFAPVVLALFALIVMFSSVGMINIAQASELTNNESGYSDSTSNTELMDLIKRLEEIIQELESQLQNNV